MAATITQSVLAHFPGSIEEFQPSQGLWLAEIPPGLPLPVIGFVHNGEQPEYTTEAAYSESGSFRFTIFAQSVEETERLALLILAVFDRFVTKPWLLNFTGGKVIAWGKTDYVIAMEDRPDLEAKRIGRAEFGYEYITEKTLP